MANVNSSVWLEQWVEHNIRSPRHVERKASMRDEAEACAKAAVAAGISIAALKDASGGDLERYLVVRQNGLADLKQKGSGLTRPAAARRGA